jgi:peptidoglycan-associated lipoprotein
MRRTTFVITIAAALSTACGKSPPTQAPAPQPAPVDMAMMHHVQDSIAAVSRARADSVERSHQMELAVRARADSIARVLMATEMATHHAAMKNTELRQELGFMIHFDVGRSQIQPDGSATLDRKVAILKANPEVRLQITGATDNRGSDAFNQALGNRRANAVKKYLVEKGIDAGRLDEKSTGEKTPLDAGKGEVAWAQNRRAEFVIVSADKPLAMRE